MLKAQAPLDGAYDLRKVAQPASLMLLLLLLPCWRSAWRLQASWLPSADASVAHYAPTPSCLCRCRLCPSSTLPMKLADNRQHERCSHPTHQPNTLSAATCGCAFGMLPEACLRRTQSRWDRRCVFPAVERWPRARGQESPAEQRLLATGPDSVRLSHCSCAHCDVAGWRPWGIPSGTPHAEQPPRPRRCAVCISLLSTRKLLPLSTHARIQHQIRTYRRSGWACLQLPHRGHRYPAAQSASTIVPTCACAQQLPNLLMELPSPLVAIWTKSERWGPALQATLSAANAAGITSSYGTTTAPAPRFRPFGASRIHITRRRRCPFSPPTSCAQTGPTSTPNAFLQRPLVQQQGSDKRE